MRFVNQILVALCICLMFASCEKELLDEETSSMKEVMVDEEGSVTETKDDIESMNEVLDDDDSEVQGHANYGQDGKCEVDPFKRNFSACADVKVSKKGFVTTTVVDFGDGCTARNGKVRKGQLIIVQSKQMMKRGAKRTITFKNYSVNGVKVKGRRVITNKGKNSAGNVVFTIRGKVRRIKRVDGVRIVRIRKINKKKEFIAGYNTCEKSDDEFIVTGGAMIIIKKINKETKIRKERARRITTPLHRKRGCRYPLGGVVTIVKSNGKRVSIDYGNGACDSMATLTKADGTSEEIDLSNR